MLTSQRKLEVFIPRDSSRRLPCRSPSRSMHEERNVQRTACIIRNIFLDDAHKKKGEKSEEIENALLTVFPHLLHLTGKHMLNLNVNVFGGGRWGRRVAGE